MYSIYEKIETNGRLKLQFKKSIVLVGCNAGIIPELLRTELSEKQNEPFQWHLSIAERLSTNKESLIIDIKPKNKKEDFIFLCELTDVFGFSSAGWTPVLLRLNGLFVDLPARQIDKKNFEYPGTTQLIYTMLHLSGSVLDGHLTGSWNFPGPSPTNSVLLWSKPFSYFIKCINNRDPKFFDDLVIVNREAK
jgi:hypothetical protein